MKKSFLTLLSLLVLAALLLAACGPVGPQAACTQVADLGAAASCANDIFSRITALVECQRGKSLSEGLACFK